MCTFRTVNLLAPLHLLLLHMACIWSARENFAKNKTRVFCFRTSKKHLANPHTPEPSIPFFFKRTQEQGHFLSSLTLSHSLTNSFTHSFPARTLFFSLFVSLSLSHTSSALLLLLLLLLRLLLLLLLLSLRFSRLLFFLVPRVCPPVASCIHLNTRCFVLSMFDCMCACLYALCATSV